MITENKQIIRIVNKLVFSGRNIMAGIILPVCFVLLFVFFFTISNTDINEKLIEPVRIGVYDEENSTVSGMLIASFKGADSLKDTFEFVPIYTKDFENEADNNNLNAIMLIPDQYTKSVLGMHSNSINIYLYDVSNSQISIIKELLGVYSGYVNKVQSASLASYDIMRDNGFSYEDRSAVMYSASYTVVMETLNRDAFFRYSTIPGIPNITLEFYWIIAFGIFYLWVLASMAVFELNKLKQSDIWSRLECIPKVKQKFLRIHYIYWWIFLIISISIIVVPGILFFELSFTIWMAIAIILSTGLILSISIMVYSIFRENGIMLLGVIAVVFGVLGGAFFPTVWMPKLWQQFSLLSPNNYMIELILNATQNNIGRDYMLIFIVAFVTMILNIISYIVLSRNIKIKRKKLPKIKKTKEKIINSMSTGRKLFLHRIRSFNKQLVWIIAASILVLGMITLVFSDRDNVDKIRVLFVDHDESQLTFDIVNHLAGNERIEIFEIDKENTNLLKSNEYDMMIILPYDLADDIEEGTKPEISIIGKPNDPSFRVVSELISSEIVLFNADNTMYKAAVEAMENRGITVTESIKNTYDEYLDNNLVYYKDTMNFNYINFDENNEIEDFGDVEDIINLYTSNFAVGLMFIFHFVLLWQCVVIIVKQKEHGIYIRLKSMGITKGILARSDGVSLMLVGQIIVVLMSVCISIAAMLTIMQLLKVVLIFSLANISICLILQFIMLITRRATAVQFMMPIAVLIMAVFGGCVLPYGMFGMPFNYISYALPSTFATQEIVGILKNEGIDLIKAGLIMTPGIFVLLLTPVGERR